MLAMDLANIPLFAMLRGRLGYLSERQRVIAENVANSDTAGFAPRDLKPFTFQAQVDATRTASVQMTTQPGHMVAASTRRTLAAGGAKPIKASGSETTLDGNSVVLEEEMMKMTDARMNYDAAIGFYQKSLGLLRMATRTPGRG